MVKVVCSIEKHLAATTLKRTLITFFKEMQVQVLPSYLLRASSHGACNDYLLTLLLKVLGVLFVFECLLELAYPAACYFLFSEVGLHYAIDRSCREGAHHAQRTGCLSPHNLAL